MRDFQDLGHNAILIIGDFTAMIGDPTGKNKTRPQLNHEQILDFSKTYIDQAALILDRAKLKILNNSEWLSKINFLKIIQISAKITVSQLIERDDFKKRYNNGIPISMHEFLYPIAQGYDSVHINSDLEVGGTMGSPSVQ